MRRDEAEKYFTNIQLTNETVAIYLVRTSVFAALRAALPQLRGELLDVGCGKMPYREYIMEHNPQITRYIGMDLDNKYGRPELVWDGVTIPLPAEAVDSILLTEVLEHCPDTRHTLNECRRVLKPGGVLFFTVPFLWPLHDVPYDEFRFTPFSLERILAAAGFERIHLSALGGWDKALAQMLGLWVGRRLSDSTLRRILLLFVKPVMRLLIRRDRVGDFTEAQMITGLTGLYRAK